jgi:hypothetical protein
MASDEVLANSTPADTSPTSSAAITCRRRSTTSASAPLSSAIDTMGISSASPSAPTANEECVSA